MPPFPFARTLVHRPIVDSTSDLARALITSESIDLPLLVLADRQTKGRGRGDHAWWSDAGSLTFTLALDPETHALRRDHEPRFALASAVAIIDAIAAEWPGLPLGIRWPNDVEALGKKLGGILPERLDTPFGPRLLIGIGLNVSTRLDHAPPDVRLMAASLSDSLAEPIEPSDVLSVLLQSLESILPRLAADDPMLAARWAELDTLLGEPLRVDLGPRILNGIGRGIDPRGALLVGVEEGVVPLFGGQVLRAPPASTRS
ncbi:MAG TPA: biotin--[acetyl-CoA-carboxylase] ligase [Isosphaeraceae bacterium]|jgi:BirA family biotin operon repressor/biotin-[acetyl-CoA-carboxylase] ligase|nr:biotin--[acetyl-CoA-carboxylase] ligase [Isosphaeraceae bacterium]